MASELILNTTFVIESAIGLRRSSIRLELPLKELRGMTHLYVEHDLKEVVKSFTELVIMCPILIESLHRCSHIFILLFIKGKQAVRVGHTCVSAG